MSCVFSDPGVAVKANQPQDFRSRTSEKTFVDSDFSLKVPLNISKLQCLGPFFQIAYSRKPTAGGRNQRARGGGDESKAEFVKRQHKEREAGHVTIAIIAIIVIIVIIIIIIIIVIIVMIVIVIITIFVKRQHKEREAGQRARPAYGHVG